MQFCRVLLKRGKHMRIRNADISLEQDILCFYITENFQGLYEMFTFSWNYNLMDLKPQINP